MKKIALIAFAAFSYCCSAMAQDTTAKATPAAPPKPKKTSLADKANDHFMIQFGADMLTSTPDSVNTGGFSRHFNFAFMLNKPFAGNPHMSAAYGIGFSSNNIFFKDTYVDVKANATRLPFKDVSATNHFQKFKVVNIFAEIPVELRWVQDPDHTNSSFKAAVGAKVGYLVKAYTKGKNLVNAAGNTVYGSGYIAKESDKKFFNSTKLAATARIGWGFLSVDATYNILNVLKDGAGPDFKIWSLGLTLSGL
jgi:hypothetical protein